MNTEDFVLESESDVLRDRVVKALSVDDIETGQVVGNFEEHVAPIIQTLEAASVVWELVGFVGGGSVAEEDALHLVREVVRELWVGFHDVGIRGVGYQDEFSSGEGFENFVQEKLADR
jgi:hypothetical protein